MNAILYPVAALVAWAAAGYKVRDLRRGQRDPSVFALAGAFVALAITFTLSTPIVWAAVDRWAGVPNLVTLLSQGFVMIFTVTVQALLLLWSYPLDQARGKVCRRLVATGIVMIAMTVLFLTAPPMEERPTDFAAQYAGDAHIAVYLLVYTAAFAVMQTEITILCLRYATAGGRPWLRRGLRITATGAVLGLVYCTARVADVLGARVGLDPHDWEPVARLAAGLGVMLPPIGWTIPSWGPSLERWWRRKTTHWQLYPLWLAIATALPMLALDPPPHSGSTGSALRRMRRNWYDLRDRLVVGDLGYRLRRRIIEINDGIRALRPYAPMTSPDDATRSAEGGEHQALRTEQGTDAAWLRAALDAHMAGRQPGPGNPEHEQASSDTDLEAEAATLTALARAFRRLPASSAPQPNSEQVKA